MLLACDLDGAEVAGVARQDLGDSLGEDRVAVEGEQLAKPEHRRADLPAVGHAARDELIDPRAQGAETVTAAKIAAEPATLEERGAVGGMLDHLFAAERAGVA